MLIFVDCREVGVQIGLSSGGGSYFGGGDHLTTQIPPCLSQETLDPDLTRYREQLKDLQLLRVEVADKVNRLQIRGDSRATQFLSGRPLSQDGGGSRNGSFPTQPTFSCCSQPKSWSVLEWGEGVAKFVFLTTSCKTCIFWKV